jgi:chromosome segregation ATPase
MARQGITQEQVFAAAEALLQEGQGVTVSSIRERIGSGSYSTISTLLAQWKQANDNRRPADIPELPASVENALRHVWALAWKETQDRIKVERDGLEAARREMERETRDMAGEIARLEAENTAQGDDIKRLEGLLAEQSKALSEAENAKQALSVENARLDERVKAAEKERDGTARLNAELTGKLDTAATALKAQERETAKVNAELVKLHDKTARFEAELAAKAKACQKLESELSKAGEAASRQAEDHAKTLAESGKTIKMLEIDKARLEERAAAAEKGAADLRGELGRLHAHVQELAGQSKPASRKKGQEEG